jgi:hypothetical protein
VVQNERDLSKAITAMQESLVRVETTLELTKDHPLRIRLLEQAHAKASWLHNLSTAALTAGVTAVVVTVAQIAITER